MLRIIAPVVIMSLLGAKDCLAADLPALLAPYSQAKSLTANFKQKKHLEKLGIILEMAGIIKVEGDKNNRKVVWQVRQPQDFMVELTQGKVTYTQKYKDQWQKKELPNIETMRPLLDTLSFDLQQLKNNFYWKQDNKTTWILIPKHDSGFVKNLKIIFSKNQRLDSFVINEKSGDVVDVKFNNLKMVK